MTTVPSWRSLPLRSALLLIILIKLSATACGSSADVAEPEYVAVTPPATIEPNAEPEPSAEPDATAEPESSPSPPAADPAPTATVPAPATPTRPPEPTSAPDPTATAEPTAPPQPTRAAVAEADHSGLAGRHGLTLQWISWEPDQWGAVEFVPLVDGTYAVTGAQEGSDGDFVRVDGIVEPVSERELRFVGDVVAQISHNFGGEPCVRSGELTFLATGDRRFWRMQDLLNCDGVVTDYVDIYFG